MAVKYIVGMILPRLKAIIAKPCLSEARSLSLENLRRYARTLGLNDKRILDIGIAGNPLKGGYDVFFREGNEYRTLDIDASYKPDYVMDICKTDLPDDSWDLVIATSLLEHVKDYNAAIHECYRILKPGGHLILETPFWYPIHTEPNFKDLWRFTPDAYKLLLRDFEMVDVAECGGVPKLPLLVSCLARKGASSAYERVQFEESAWTIQDKNYQELLKDSIDYVVNKVADNKNFKILDVGCGDGFSLGIFKQHGFFNVTGIDISPQKVQLARKFGHTVYEQDLHDLKIVDNGFDIVFCSHTLEHSHDIRKAVSQIKRVTKRGGVAFFVVPIEKNIKNLAHMQTITEPSYFTRIISEAGFDIVEERRTKRLEDELWLLCINRPQGDNKENRFVLDFDDLSPGFDRFDLLLKLKENLPYFKASLFTVANFENKNPLSQFPGWCDKVKALDFVELLIHGYCHTFKEFEKLKKDEIRRRVMMAESEFTRAGLKYKKIFKAPNWALNSDVYEVLHELGYAVADHKDNLTWRRLRCYQYNWSVNEPVPDLPVIRGHGHMQNVCGNGLEENLTNIFSLKRDTKFYTISEMFEIDSKILKR